MGLDVAAYEKATLMTSARTEGWEAALETYYDEEPDGVKYFYHAGFEQRGDGLPEGLYAVEDKQFRFRAGSYSGYNAWRNALSLMATHKPARYVWDNPQPGPFVELIHFADNEGFIGPQTCAKLASDFQEWQDRADEYFKTTYHPSYLQTYSEFRRAFELAANGGVVEFR